MEDIYKTWPSVSLTVYPYLPLVIRKLYPALGRSDIISVKDIMYANVTQAALDLCILNYATESNNILMDDVRVKRDQLLAETDWAVLNDAPVLANLQAFLDYRQALRDIPTTYPDATAVVWPVKP